MPERRSIEPRVAKLLVILAIVIAITPLSSLYGVYWALQHQHQHELPRQQLYHFMDSDDIQIMAARTRSKKSGISNNDLDVDDIIRSIFGVNTNNIIMSSRYSLYDNNQYLNAPILMLILPWFCSLCIGVIIPLLHLYIYHRRRRFYLNINNRSSVAFEKIKVCDGLRLYKKVLQEMDIVTTTDNLGEEEKREDRSSTCNNYPSSEKQTTTTNYSIIMLPQPGIKITEIKKPEHLRLVSSSTCCAICLMSYNVNDTVVWSSNKNCHDIYHESCLTSWFHQKKNFSCPCCRQDFVVLDEISNNNCCSSSSDVVVTREVGEEEEVELLQRSNISNNNHVVSSEEEESLLVRNDGDSSNNNHVVSSEEEESLLVQDDGDVDTDSNNELSVQ